MSSAKKIPFELKRPPSMAAFSFYLSGWGRYALIATGTRCAFVSTACT
jgi:hypothetical protein